MTIVFFDPTSLHPAAASAIDRDGQALIDAREVGTLTHGSPSFKSRREVKGAITDDDLVGEPLLTWSNLAGQTVGRYFLRNGQLVALRENGYRLLRRLVEKVAAAKPFSSGLSDQFLEVEIFKWWRATVREEARIPLSAHLLTVCAEAVAPRRLLVPLSNLEIERPFQLGDVLVTPLGSRLSMTLARSRQVHHLATINDENVLDRFFEHMFMMLTAAMDNMPRYKEHADFLDALDRIKFS
ncbi:hypothetical protein [Pseudorhodoplanes sp.]|uniref:hypothetical protein n=1 Tax=Pseudorhodoplanes sp. TaxID=1934341 RepID=UPI002C6E46EA|nr:hypothetical protein [Pseudorhodoplanes sp.]HWV53106.1 hypothetical protein [Pseudorhodoplanes sp.]